MKYLERMMINQDECHSHFLRSKRAELQRAGKLKYRYQLCFITGDIADKNNYESVGENTKNF
jgi:hypothetical protein